MKRHDRFVFLILTVVLAVGWPAMETVAQNPGSLDGKIVIDISMPVEQAEDGYYVSIVATSSAEMIQSWNPGARVVKAFATQASYVIEALQRLYMVPLVQRRGAAG